MKMGITEITRMNFMALLPQQLANYLTRICREEDVTMRVKWSDLPQDLVIAIAGLLGLVDFVRFRCVCKEWTSASAPVAAKIESTLKYKPWFLLYKDYEDSGKCTLVTDCGKQFTMKLRQLIGTTCIASNQGWLLMFKPGRKDQGQGDARTSTNTSSSIFFFRPVTKAKVVLPQLPFSELSNSVAAFSCPPTEQDCTVCIIRHSGYDYFKLHVLFRGAKNWMLGRIYCTSAGPIRCAGYHKQEFYFFDLDDGLIKVRVDSCDKKLLTTKFSKCVPEPKGTKEVSADSFYRKKNYCRETEMKQKLGLADYILSTCGTKTESANGNAEFFFNERLTSRVARTLQGVWIYPKFYQKSPKAQRW